MPLRDKAEITETIREIEERFPGLDSQEKRYHAIEDGSYDYQAEVPDNLGVKVTRRARRSTHALRTMRSALTWPKRPRVYIPKGGATADTDQDNLEAFFSHVMLRVDPRNILTGGMSDHITRSRFAALWAGIVERDEPLRRPHESKAGYELRLQQWHQNYWRWKLELMNPASVGFLDRNGEITVATIKEELPIIDFIDRFGGAMGTSDTRPTMIARKELKGIRATDGIALGRATDDIVMKSSIKYFLVDDGVKIHVLIEQPGRGNRKEFVEVAESYDNTFGAPSLILAHGTYRSTAPMGSRYEGLGWPLLECERDWNVAESILWTIGANKRWALSPAEGAARDPRQSGETAIRFFDEQGRTVVPGPQGELMDVSNVILPELVRGLDEIKEQFAFLTQDLQLLIPTPEMIERATSSGILFGADASMRPFNEANGSINSAFETFFRYVGNDIVVGLNPHLKVTGPLKGKDTSVKFTAVGSEVSPKPLERGAEYDLPPSLFMSGYNVSVEPVAQTRAQRAAEVEQEMQKLFAPVPMTTPDRVLEANGERNVSERSEEIAAYQWYQETATLRANMRARDAIREVSIVEERDEDELLLLAAPMLAALPAPTEPQGTGGLQVKAPEQPMPGVSSNGVGPG